jgi:hypothetical protein
MTTRKAVQKQMQIQGSFPIRLAQGQDDDTKRMIESAVQDDDTKRMIESAVQDDDSKRDG